MNVRPLLETTARRLSHDLAVEQATGRLPSMVAGVVRDGGLAWAEGRGRTVRAGSQERPDADTQYKIGSVSKTFTGALVMLARERGLLSLSDRVSRFLPEGPFPDATLRELLSHTSGMTAEPLGPWWERSPGVDRARLVDTHRRVEPVLEPGTRFHYSNLGFGVLGEVAADVLGAASWFDAVREHLLDPLGMRRTTYQWSQPCAEGFSVDLLTGELTPEPLPDTGVMAAAGQLWSTASDLATWLTALVDPASSVLQASSLQLMRTAQGAAPEDRAPGTYGLGVQVVLGRRQLVGHGGSMPGFCCGVLVDVDSKVGAVVLTNGAYGLTDLPGRMLSTVLDAEPADPPEWAPVAALPDDVRDLVGTWFWGHAATLLAVEHADGDEVSLAMGPVRGSGRQGAFRRTGRDSWTGTRGYFTGETLQLVRDDQGRAHHLEVATFVYTRTPYDPTAPIPGGAPTARG